jgi:hypothetical protein
MLPLHRRIHRHGRHTGEDDGRVRLTSQEISVEALAALSCIVLRSRRSSHRLSMVTLSAANEEMNAAKATTVAMTPANADLGRGSPNFCRRSSDGVTSLTTALLETQKPRGYHRIAAAGWAGSSGSLRTLRWSIYRASCLTCRETPSSALAARCLETLDPTAPGDHQQTSKRLRSTGRV